MGNQILQLKFKYLSKLSIMFVLLTIVLILISLDDASGQRKCEAYFYLGQYYLLRNDKEKAAQMFKLCLETKVTSFVEYKGAKLELEKMGLE